MRIVMPATGGWPRSGAIGRMAILSAGFGLLGACSPQRQPHQVDVGAAAARAQGDIAKYAVQSAKPGGAQSSTRIAAPSAETMPEAAAAVVRRYFQRIAAHDYRGARALWGRGGAASGLDEAAFAARLSPYHYDQVTIARPGNVDAGAGQLHIAIPVRVAGGETGRSGRRFADSGLIMLHRVNDGIETRDAEAHLWRIESSTADPDIPVAHARAASERDSHKSGG